MNNLKYISSPMPSLHSKQIGEWQMPSVSQRNETPQLHQYFANI